MRRRRRRRRTPARHYGWRQPAALAFFLGLCLPGVRGERCMCDARLAVVCVEGMTYPNACWAECSLGLDATELRRTRGMTEGQCAGMLPQLGGAWEQRGSNGTAVPSSVGGDAAAARAVAVRAAARGLASASTDEHGESAQTCGYAKVESGTCASHGLVTIKGEDQCTLAARAVGLAYNSVNTTASPRPEGCFFSADSGALGLYLSTNTENAGNGGDASYHALCAPPHDDDAHGHGSHPHVALWYMFFMLMSGTATLHFMSRYCPKVPYTCVLLFEGFAFAVLNNFSNQSFGHMSDSMAMWIGIDPHLLLYAFLPALLFGDTMGLNIHVSKKCFWQCLLLAGPGVLIGSAALGAVAKYVFPYGWDWPTSLLFGSICSATDPVAVVALLNSLGASPKLTMLISGESMMNDGTAIVVFTILMDSVRGVDKSVLEIAGTFIRMAGAGPVIGAAFGWFFVRWIAGAARKAEKHDSMIQLCLTITCAYMTFFIAENELRSSGVLATVAAAVMVAAFAWPLFCEGEMIHHVWHVFEYIGNTILFILAGTIVGNTCTTRFGEYIQWEDYGWSILFWILSIIIRFLMIWSFSPILGRCGYGISFKEILVMSWGGLRGAVGLALAIYVDGEMAALGYPRTGSLVLFHVGGLALLTLMVNAVSASTLLAKLKMTGIPETKKMMLNNVKERLIEHAEADYKITAEEVDLDLARGVHSDVTHNHEKVMEFVTMLRVGSTQEERAKVRELWNIGVDDPRFPRVMVAVRHIFFRVLKASYWDLIERGFIREASSAARALLYSTEAAADHASEGIFDWQYLVKFENSVPFTARLWGCIGKCLPEWFYFDDYVRGLSVFSHQEESFYLAACFIRAHKKAQHVVADYLGDDDSADTVFEKKIVAESNAVVELAKEMILRMDAKFVETALSKQVASICLRKQRAFVMEVLEEGFLSNKEASNMMALIAHDMLAISRADSVEAQQRAREKFASKSSFVQSIIQNEQRVVQVRQRAKSLSSNKTVRSLRTGGASPKKSSKVQPEGSKGQRENESKAGRGVVVESAVVAPFLQELESHVPSGLDREDSAGSDSSDKQGGFTKSKPPGQQSGPATASNSNDIRVTELDPLQL